MASLRTRAEAQPTPQRVGRLRPSPSTHVATFSLGVGVLGVLGVLGLLGVVGVLVGGAGGCTFLVELEDYPPADDAGLDGGGHADADAADASPPCTPDATEVCYTGPSGSLQGACAEGVRTCQASGAWGACEGEVTPAIRCAGRECGDDGCGGVCGECETNVECADATGICLREDMVLVLGGSFDLGSPVDEAGHQTDEPVTSIQLSREFYMDRTEVTNEQYLRCRLQGHCAPPTTCDSGTPVWFSDIAYPESFADHPVVCVTWQMATAYCAWVGKRLCTEAEWEKACIHGQDHHIWPWGDTWPGDIHHYANCDEGYCYDEHLETAPVGYFYEEWQLGATPGTLIVDLAGNVSEWVADWYQSDYYGEQVVDPRGPCDGDPQCGGRFVRVHRGGHYASDKYDLRCSRRLQMDHTARSPRTGIRCCRDYTP